METLHHSALRGLPNVAAVCSSSREQLESSSHSAEIVKFNGFHRRGTIGSCGSDASITLRNSRTGTRKMFRKSSDVVGVRIQPRSALAAERGSWSSDGLNEQERGVDVPKQHGSSTSISMGGLGVKQRTREAEGVTAAGGGLRKNERAAVPVDYMKYLQEYLTDESSSLSWFCPVLENKPPQDAPILLFLPEVVGTGLGFSMQQENLGRLFELRCLKIPLRDRTPFEGLVSFVEETVRNEARNHPGRPIYLLGESFGGVLALAVAARNPKLDLVLYLINPTTSFEQSPLRSLSPVIQALPSAVSPAIPLLLGLINYDPVSLASQVASSFAAAQNLPENLSNVLQLLTSTLPENFLPWKLKLLQSSARYVNSRLRAVKADVFILASAKDDLLPSVEEAKRLTTVIPTATYRSIPEGGHILLLEKEFQMATAIKGSGLYRRTKSRDPVTNFVPPTREEMDKAFASFKLLRSVLSPVFFSVGDDGKVVQGLSKLPVSKTPLIFVGNHFLYGMDMGLVWCELMNECGLLPRGLAHPVIFEKTMAERGHSDADRYRLFGAVAVNGKNMYKLLSQGESVTVYPGGAREALHRKNEWHQLFWPTRPEIIRMGAKFGATFIPMCGVGEDDIFEILLDFDDYKKLPVVGEQIMKTFDGLPRLRQGVEGEVGEQTLHVPVVAPKLGGPGRMYIHFGQPIYTEGREEYFKDPKNVEAEYLRLKSGVENGISYLLNKRKEDPYRQFLPRITYELTSGGKQAPTFEP
ncbi:hypothetical protein R1sor_004650 [Riccia sorocarpa]|uniref:Serine aminopeptidase S33 domain-containing protein n=1 Tax=Riccia sorocarpa TaxID=122646 RepID=A0ABD3HL91_9MARC